MWFGLIITLAKKLSKFVLLSLYHCVELAHYARPKLASFIQPYDSRLHRRQDATYGAKKKLVYYAWCITLSTMIILPVPAYLVGAALFTTFVSFMILDEM